MTKHGAPPASDNAGINSGVSSHFTPQKASVLSLFFIFFFKLDIFSRWQKIAVKVTLECVFVRFFSLRGHQTRASVSRVFLTCACVCVFVQAVSRLGEDPVHTWSLIRCADETNSTSFLSLKQILCYEFIISWLPVWGRVQGSSLCGLIKPNSCWFVLVMPNEMSVVLKQQ